MRATRSTGSFDWSQPMPRHDDGVTGQSEQLDLLAFADQRQRATEANTRRAKRRGFVVFATDPSVDALAPDYRLVFATEAATPGQAVRKVAPRARGRRLRAFLGTGQYRDQYTAATWVD